MSLNDIHSFFGWTNIRRTLYIYTLTPNRYHSFFIHFTSKYGTYSNLRSEYVGRWYSLVKYKLNVSYINFTILRVSRHWEAASHITNIDWARSCCKTCCCSHRCIRNLIICRAELAVNLDEVRDICGAAAYSLPSTKFPHIAFFFLPFREKMKQ